MVKLIECPRDAMQGIHTLIPTRDKIDYLNLLLEVGFDTLDCGSFVSPKAIQQMADTHEVLKSVNGGNSKTKLLVIVANIKGAQDAVEEEKVTYLGYPFSISETFQQRNTNRSRDTAFADLMKINDLCRNNGKELVVYLSMGFGNPYGDDWSIEIISEWFEKIAKQGIGIISLADTVGNANNSDIRVLFSSLIEKFDSIEIGAHFHSSPTEVFEKLDAAYLNGCRRFDSAMLGFGGCPMAEDELVGNINTDSLISFLTSKKDLPHLDLDALAQAREKASSIFGQYK